VANGAVYLLGEGLQPVPPGCAGELYAGGPGVARGYLGEPAMTAERFPPNPFGPPGSRLYRTGDRVRALPDGNLLFLGRTDFQLKVQGHRIEPGEIEATLLDHPAVDEAVVVARGEGERRWLAAYVVGREAVPPDELREFLRSKLPHYMVPGAFVRLDALPVTPQGKIDRAALPAPEADLAPERELVTPRTPLERQVAAVFAEVLEREQVGAFDDFFELGGQSLLATKATARLRDVLGKAVPLAAVFAHPTVAGLAAHLSDGSVDGRPSVEPIRRRRDSAATVPASSGQERLWLIAELDEAASRAYNVPGAVAVEGELDLAILERALGTIVARHEALRTGLGMADGEVRQEIAPDARVEVPVVDLTELPDERRVDELARLAAEEAQRPFDLGAPPLLRATVFRLRDGADEATGRSPQDVSFDPRARDKGHPLTTGAEEGSVTHGGR
jgi:hypothetical protein